MRVHVDRLPLPLCHMGSSSTEPVRFFWSKPSSFPPCLPLQTASHHIIIVVVTISRIADFGLGDDKAGSQIGADGLAVKWFNGCDQPS